MNPPPKQDEETLRAEAMLKPCPKCQGFPVLRYEPGCSYSTCSMLKPECPCINVSPDFDPVGLVEKINRKNSKNTIDPSQ